MNQCPHCNADVTTGLSICASCGLDVSSEFESTKLSDDRKGQEPTEVMPAAFQTGQAGDFTPGTVLAGRYRLIMSIGKGGMGEVYKADDLELNQTVAIKFLPAAIAQDEAALRRFRSEVRTARQVAHPNVCRVFDIAEANGVYFITMEYVDGDDLSGLLRRIGRLPQDKAIETSRQLCLGLHAIHDAGILHRDLKPANIIIDSRGKARITDFGIAGVEADLTKDDFRSGTPAYMSPEQIDGAGVTQKSDIYSLGLLLYEIFTGKQAMQFESLPELIYKHQSTTPTNPSDILKDIDPLVEKTILQCLEKDPDDRPKSALQVALMLPGGNPLEAAIVAGETPSPEMVAAAPKKGELSVRTAAICLAAVLLLLVFNAFMEYRYWVIPTDEKSSEVLVARARSIASNLGYAEKPVDLKYGFDGNFAYVPYADQNPEIKKESWEMVRTGQPAIRVFRYRQSPRPIVPTEGSQVTAEDPVIATPGEMSVLTDPVGRLIEFQVKPLQDHESSGEKKAADWRQLFVEAGLDQGRYEQVQPDHVPPVFADERAAWTGPFISNPSIKVQIEAAAYNGKPVYFRVAAPWNSASVSDLMTPPIAAQVIVFTLLTAILIGIVVLSWHNFRMGRGDFRGSVRVMVFFLVVHFFGGLFLADHVPELWSEMQILAWVIRQSVFLAVLSGLMYSALEPQLRRLWPELLISWSRLVSGGLSDPMVGRDILMGALLGVATYSVVILQMYLPVWFADRPLLPTTHSFRWDGFLHGFADSISWLTTSLEQALFFVFILFIALFISRRKWIATAAIMLLYGALGIANAPHPELLPFNLVMAALSASTLSLSIIRFGIVGGTVCQMFFITLINRPFIFNPESIYFEVSVSGALVMLTIVFYAFYISTGGKAFALSTFLDGRAQPAK